jgi:hypothetical protein
MRIVCIGVAVAGVLFGGTPASRAQGISDKSPRAVKAVTLPAAGGSYVDPVFGSKIIRVTDARDGTRCTHGYSYWPAFNSDGTRLMIACDDVIKLYRFDRATDRLTPDGTLIGADGYKVQFDGATWSHATSAPSTVYAVDARGTRLWRILVSSRGLSGYTLLKDFGAWSVNRTVQHLSVSDDNDVYSIYTRDRTTNAAKDVLVWERSIDKVRVFPRPSGKVVNEAHVSRDGAQVMVNFDDEDVALWDFRAGTVTWLRRGVTADNVGGHFDVGRDFIANSDAYRTGIALRTPSAARDTDNLVTYTRPDGKLNWSLSDHVSLREENEEWAAVSTYDGDGSGAAFEDEIFIVRTDGTRFVRLAHSRSKELHPDPAERYYAQPRGVVDRAGRYIVFTSDLGSSSRFDVMIVKIPSAYWPN